MPKKKKKSLVFVCGICKHLVCFYRGKNRKYFALKMAFCEHPKAPDFSQGRNRKFIETYRTYLKIKTSPRWCPLKKEL